MSIKHTISFCREFRRTFRTTGAVLPSSRFLAQAITARAAATHRPTRLLEAGPGTGAFTDLLMKMLQPGDSLVLAELNDRFVEILDRRLGSEADWQAKREQVRLFHGSVSDLDTDLPFDAIVCGLPFNNFEPQVVEELLGQLLGRLAPGGTFSFFEYLAIRRLKSPFVRSKERARLAKVAQVVQTFIDQYQTGFRRVLLNVPPAIVHHLQVNQ